MNGISSEQRSDLLAKLSAARASMAHLAKRRENCEREIENLRQILARADQRALAALQQGREDVARQILVKKVAAQKELADGETRFQELAAVEQTLTRRLREHEAQVEAIVGSPHPESLSERARLRQERVDAVRQRAGLASATVRVPKTRTQQPATVARRPAITPIAPLAALLAQLDALTGLASVKADIRQLIDLTLVDQKRRAAGLPVAQVSRHLIFTGNPGTGKTTVARLIAQLYAAIGVLPTGQLVEVTRTDLVAGYVGQTAIKTTNAMKRALGGVLFIDEAYALTRSAGTGNDFGQEAIDTLVQLMEDHRDKLVVIAAGYPKEMTQFTHANPGLPSRFPHTIHFPDYTTDELITIFQAICTHNRYQPTPAALTALRRHLANTPRTPGFGNGRLIRNTFEAALPRQASRIITTNDPDLATLTPPDLGLPDSIHH